MDITVANNTRVRTLDTKCIFILTELANTFVCMDMHVLFLSNTRRRYHLYKFQMNKDRIVICCGQS